MTMQILTAADMAETDRRTSQAFGISISTLMENAGTAVADFSARQYPEAQRVLVLCGKGNNGGDGLVAARILAGLGRSVTVALLGHEADLKGEAAVALFRLKPTSSELRIVTDEAALDALDIPTF